MGRKVVRYCLQDITYHCAQELTAPAVTAQELHKPNPEEVRPKFHPLPGIYCQLVTEMERAKSFLFEGVLSSRFPKLRWNG